MDRSKMGKNAKNGRSAHSKFGPNVIFTSKWPQPQGLSIFEKKIQKKVKVFFLWFFERSHGPKTLYLVKIGQIFWRHRPLVHVKRGAHAKFGSTKSFHGRARAKNVTCQNGHFSAPKTLRGSHGAYKGFQKILFDYELLPWGVDWILKFLEIFKKVGAEPIFESLLHCSLNSL